MGNLFCIVPMKLLTIIYSGLALAVSARAADPARTGPIIGNVPYKMEYKDGVLHTTGFPPGTEIKGAYTGRIGIVHADGTVKELPTGTNLPKTALKPAFLSLPNSKIILAGPDGWTIKDRDGEIGLYSPDQPPKGLPNRIHFSRRPDDKTLQGAIDSEIDKVTARSPAWGSGCDRRSYKGSTPVVTASGIKGLRADFYSDLPADNQRGRYYSIIKYYFFDEGGKIFRVCSHVYGDESRFKVYDQAIIAGLKFKKGK